MPRSKTTYEQLIDFAAGDYAEGTETSEEEAATIARFRAVSAAAAVDPSVDPPRAAVRKAKALFTQPRTSVFAHALETLERMVAAITYDSRAEPALAGYRGAGDAVRLSFECDLGEIDLEVMESGDERIIMGQIGASNADESVQVALAHAGTAEVVIAARVSGDGIFSLESSPGTFDLCVLIDESLVIVPHIEID